MISGRKYALGYLFLAIKSLADYPSKGKFSLPGTKLYPLLVSQILEARLYFLEAGTLFQ